MLRLNFQYYNNIVEMKLFVKIWNVFKIKLSLYSGVLYLQLFSQQAPY